MDTQIKLTASSQTTPKEIETIFQQNEIEWIYDYDSKKLSIIKLDESIFSDCNNKEFSLGIYGWDKQREIVKTIILGNDLNYPIDLNLKKDFDDFLGIPRFKIIIFENKTKRIMKSSKDFIMTDKDQKDSLIKMIPQRIGNKIAELDLQDLDEGPIIEQCTVNVSHRDEIHDLIRKGRDIERIALARAVRLHLNHQVFVYNSKTAVFD